MNNKAYSSEMLMALPGDREKPSSLEGGVNDAARGSRVGESVGRGHI